MLVRFSAALAAALALVISAPPAAADPDGGTVRGTLELPKEEQRGNPPVRNRGFFARMPNSVLPPRSFDPRPEVVVVLEGGTPHPDDTEPPKIEVEYELIGASFEVPILPVVQGTEVELVNGSKHSPRLYSPDDSELLDGAPVDPNGTRSFEAPKDGAVRALEIRSRDSAHLSGRILSVPHAYFARADGAGKFEIEGVPAGSWTVRVWYRSGWMGPSQKVEVNSRRTSKVTIELPGQPSGAGAEEG